MTTSGESSARSRQARGGALSSCLRSAGYTVSAGPRGSVERRSSLEGSPSEIIVLDPARMGVSGAELQERLRQAALHSAIALTARNRLSSPADGHSQSDLTGQLRVDTPGRRIFLGETELKLSPKERELLAYLLRRPGVALTRTQLLHDVWSRDGSEMAKTVDVHVRWLRQRLAAYAPLGVQIVTVRGTGYRLDLSG